MLNVLEIGRRAGRQSKRVGSIAFDQNNTKTIKLEPSAIARYLYLRLSGSMNISVGGTATFESPLGLLKNIKLTVNGGKTLWTGSGRDLYQWAHHLYGKVGELVAPSGTGAAVAIAAALKIPFEALRLMQPQDSLWDMRPYNEILIEITWGSTTDVLTGGTASINSTTAVDVYVDTTAELAEGLGTLLRRVNYVEQTITGTQSDLGIELPQNGILSRLLIRTDRDGAGVDNIVNKLTLRVDDDWDWFRELKWVDIQNDNVQEFQLSGAGTGARVTGYAFLDLTEQGRISTALNAITSKPKLILDVTKTSGTELVRVSLEYFEPVPRPIAA